jgi:periplasmic nitrate reductase NapD
MTDELHIASLVVHASPARLEGASQCIAAMPGARIHASSPAGKLVVTLEAGSSDEILSQVNRIQQADGVLTAALVCQYSDTRAAMMEEVPEGDTR